MLALKDHDQGQGQGQGHLEDSESLAPKVSNGQREVSPRVDRKL